VPLLVYCLLEFVPQPTSQSELMFHYPHHIGDFDKATRHLTRLERSIYRDLLDFYYESEKQLPLDLSFVCRRILANSNEERTAVEQVLNEFFHKTPDGWYHIRCEAEIDKFHANISQKSEAGKRSAEKRALKLQQALNGRSTDVQREVNGTPTNQEPRTNNQEPIKDIRDIPSESSTRNGVPFQQIIDLYHAKLPTLPRFEKLTTQRKGYIRQRWLEDLPDLDHWGNFFEYVAKSAFLTGKAPAKDGKPPFRADLEWITRPANFAKIYEDKYHR
jgi:uncharacterized protein YdaU (DUF1376 family)